MNQSQQIIEALIERKADFPDLEDIRRSDVIQELEDAWIGGVADFGDPAAALAIVNAPGYRNYINDIRKEIRKTLGSSFKVWRSIRQEQLDDWRSGTDIGPIAVTTIKSMAVKWKNFAGNKKDADRVLIELKIASGNIIMVGKPEEHELVADANGINAKRIKVVS